VPVSLPPAVPTGVTATVDPGSTTTGIVDLAWHPSMGATSYVVSMSTTSSGPFTANQTVSATTATISGLTLGRTYYFVIVAAGITGSTASTPIAFTAKKYLI